MRACPPMRAVKKLKPHSSTKIKLAFAFCVNANSLRDDFVSDKLRSIRASSNFLTALAPLVYGFIYIYGYTYMDSLGHI